MTIVLEQLNDRDMMNKYANQISARWRRTAPTRYSQLENPELFFEELGQLVLSRVDGLVPSLQLQAPAQDGETYLQSVARMTALQRQAEEIAMSELEWPPVELSLSELREEWEATSPPDAALVEWASQLEEAPAEDQLEALSAEWMLPMGFLYDLATSTNPWTFSAEHSETLTSSREQRYERFLQGM